MATGADNLGDRLRYALSRLTNQQKILLMVAIAAIIAIAVAASTWLKQADYRILFSNIGERDGGAIIAALDQMNVPYKFNDSGGAILIPGSKVHEVRLRLASQGLPKSGGVGFELLENQKFGISQFAEQINYQRGLEGELARTIQSIGAVQAARVHLAIPKPTVFVREELKPSASVLLNLYPGRSLEPSQIAGIQNLVAASVPNLATASVTLIDQSGAMLSQLKSKLTEAGLDPIQLRYVQEIESSAIKRIEAILEPIVGKGNARVQVAADVDFSQSEQTAETHRPNATPPEVSIRSQQTSESASTTPSAQGVPGALTNQPPVPATAPLTQPPVAGAGAPPAAPGQPVPGQLNAAGVQAFSSLRARTTHPAYPLPEQDHDPTQNPDLAGRAAGDLGHRHRTGRRHAAAACRPAPAIDRSAAGRTDARRIPREPSDHDPRDAQAAGFPAARRLPAVAAPRAGRRRPGSANTDR